MGETKKARKTGKRKTATDVMEHIGSDEALRESEERYRLVFENSGEAILLTQPDGTIYSANPAACKLFGKSEEEIRRSGRSGVIDPNDTRLKAALEERKRTGQFKGGLNFKRADGTIFPAEISTAFFKDSHGNDRTSMIIRDVTERTRAEEALKASEARLRAVLENSRDAIGVHVNGVWQMCNPAAVRLFGATAPEELLGTLILEVIAPSERQRIRDYVSHRVERTGAPVAYVTRGLRSDGTEFDMDVTLSDYDLGGVLHVLVILRDISERMRAEDAIRASEDKYRKLFAEMIDGFARHEIVCDDKGKAVDYVTLEVNHAYESLLNVQSAAVVGKRASETLSPAELKHWLGIFGPVALSGISTHYELYSPLNQKYFEGTAYSPERGKFAVTFSDVTARRQAEARLEESEARMRALFDNAGYAMGMAQAGTQVMVNQAYLDLFGYENASEVIGNSLLNDIAHVERARLQAYAMSRARGEPAPTLYETRGIRRDESVFDMDVRTSTYEFGGQTYTVGIMRDITERKRAEEALQASESKYRLLFENMDEAFSLNEIIADESGRAVDFRILDANAAYERNIGMRLEDCIGKTIREIFPGVDVKQIEKYGEVARTGEPHSFDTFSQTLGRHFHVRVFCPQFGRFGLLFEDVTENKRAEEALRESQEFLNSILENSPNALFIADEHGTLLRMNQALRDNLHLRDDEVVGKYNILKDNVIQAQGFMPLVEDVFAKGTATHFIILYDTAAVEGIELEHTTQAVLDIHISPILDSHGKVTHAIIQHVDITEQRSAEEALRESEAKYRDLFNNSQVGMFRTRLDGSEMLDMNDKYLEIFGRTRAEMQGSRSSIYWADPREREEMVRQLQVEDRVADFECGMLNKKGEVRRCLTSLRLYREQGILEGSIIDITERKRAEEALRRSEERYRALFDNLPIPAFTKDLNGTYTSCNKENLRYFTDNPVGRTDAEIAAPEIAAILQANDQSVIIKGAAVETEELLKNTPLGDRFCITHKVPLRDGYGNIIGILGASLDITERKRAEQALHDSQERFRSYFELGLIGMAITSPTKGWIEVNEQMCKILGYERGELFQMTWDKMTHPDDLAADATNFTRVMNGEIDGYSLDKRWIRKDGRVIDSTIAVKCLRRPDGSVDYFVALAQDVTERKRAEQALRDSEESYRALFEQAHDAITVANEADQILDANRRACEVYGRSREELLSMTVPALQALHVRGPSGGVLKGELLLHGNSVFETTDIRPDGTLFPVEITVSRVARSQGDRYISIVRDITERKRAEEALRQSEAQYRALVEQAADGIFVTDAQGRYLDVNPSGCAMLGYTLDELLRMDYTSILLPEDLAQDPVKFDLLKAGRIIVRERIYRRKDGTLFSVEISARMLSDGRIQDIVRDISERKRAEETLRESELRFRTLIEQAPIAISISRDGIGLYSNEKSAQLFGLTNAADYAGRPTAEYIAPQLQEESKERTRRRSLGLDVPLEFESIGMRTDGSQFPIQVTVAPIRLSDGAANMAFIADITERKRAEETLAASEARFRSVVQTAHDAIITQDSDGNIVFWNDSAESIFGYPADEMVGKPLNLLLPERFRELHLQGIQDAAATRKVRASGENVELFGLAKNGHEFPVELSLARWDAEGKTFFTAVIRDITERSLAEQERQELMLQLESSHTQLQALSGQLINAQENERREIARELHDEIGQVLTAVKTNLQTNQLETNAQTLHDHLADSIGVVDIALDQIRALSLNLRPSLLDDFGLMPTLEWFLERQGRRTGLAIAFETDLHNTRFPPELESAVFRVVQSALTNAERHAHASKVRVSLHEIPAAEPGAAAELELGIRDDGVGFDQAAAFERSMRGESLGLVGMQERVRLVNGRLEIHSGPGMGTEIIAHFPLIKE